MRWYKKETDAYFTLEACFLVPLTFFLFALVIHICFYLYGRALLVQDAYILAFRASLLSEEKDREAFVAENEGMQIGNKYFGNERPGVTTSVEGKTITVELQTAARRSGFDLADASPWSSQTKARAVHYDTSAHMRRVKRIADIIRAGLRTLNGGGQ